MLEIIGTIIGQQDTHDGTCLVVSYVYNGKRHLIQELLSYLYSPIKFLGLKIGEKRIPIMKDHKLGSHVLVWIDPDYPSMGFLPENRLN